MMQLSLKFVLISAITLAGMGLSSCQTTGTGAAMRGTGDLGIVVERATGAVQVVDTTARKQLFHVTGLGDLSHASAVYSRDARFAYIFGRDGGLNKVDILTGKLVNRVMQAGNSIGGAISQNGRLVAVSNYKPGGVKVFNADTLELVANIPTGSKVVGLVDAPGSRFVFSLYDSGEIWIADFSTTAMTNGSPAITRFSNIGDQPYDGLITPDGRHYIAGLFGEDGLAKLDLWHPEKGVQRILAGYGRGEKPMPVYKMPHLEGWAIAGSRAFIPAIGRHEVLVVDTATWAEVGRIPVHGQPVFVMAQPGGRQIWVNFAFPRNDTVQVINSQSLALVKTLTPGKGVLHMEFAPRGEEVWLSVRDTNRIEVVDTETYRTLAELNAHRPSGIFFTARAHRTGL